MSKNALPPLGQVDPLKAWQPWEPSERDPWSVKWAGHLIRRAGFGAGLAELRQAVKDGPAATLDKLFLDDEAARALTTTLETYGKRIAQANNGYQLRGWWVYTMLNTKQPAREKMTLFWHNHFATSINKIMRANLMLARTS